MKQSKLKLRSQQSKMAMISDPALRSRAAEGSREVVVSQ
jgi:hypothetical protein